MSMKTMLIPTEQRTSMSSTLQTALLLARRFDSYVEGFALQPALNELLAVDIGGGRRCRSGGLGERRRREPHRRNERAAQVPQAH